MLRALPPEVTNKLTPTSQQQYVFYLSHLLIFVAHFNSYLRSWPSEKKKYESDDGVDEYLVNQVAKHVLHDKLGRLSGDLRISSTEYSKITAPNMFNEDDQINKASVTNV